MNLCGPNYNSQCSAFICILQDNWDLLRLVKLVDLVVHFWTLWNSNFNSISYIMQIQKFYLYPYSLVCPLVVSFSNTQCAHTSMWRNPFIMQPVVYVNVWLTSKYISSLTLVPHRRSWMSPCKVKWSTIIKMKHPPRGLKLNLHAFPLSKNFLSAFEKKIMHDCSSMIIVYISTNKQSGDSPIVSLFLCI